MTDAQRRALALMDMAPGCAVYARSIETLSFGLSKRGWIKPFFTERGELMYRITSEGRKALGPRDSGVTGGGTPPPPSVLPENDIGYAHCPHGVYMESPCDHCIRQEHESHSAMSMKGGVCLECPDR